jgi:hypothetical protein
VRLAPTPQQASRFRRDDGARRFACDWAVGQIHETLGSGSETGQDDSVVWSHFELRKRWNRVKPEVPPWRSVRRRRSRARIADEDRRRGERAQELACAGDGQQEGTQGEGSRGSPRKTSALFAAPTPRRRCASRIPAMWCCLALDGCGPLRTSALSPVMSSGTARVLAATVREKGRPWERVPRAGDHRAPVTGTSHRHGRRRRRDRTGPNRDHATDGTVVARGRTRGRCGPRSPTSGGQPGRGAEWG